MKQTSFKSVKSEPEEFSDENCNGSPPMFHVLKKEERQKSSASSSSSRDLSTCATYMVEEKSDMKPSRLSALNEFRKQSEYPSPTTLPTKKRRSTDD